DRIVSWAAAPGFPAEWRGQLRPDGVAVLPLTGTPAVVRRFRHVEGRIQGDGAIPGEFVKLTGWPAVM
ncbi:MAG: protein-L-isoaspartate O-methyltransferase, partial [Candidatus Dormibacteraeota bacterium]|nr:protein-L-isoaspartate O-methyltransferase [Candidatus Dormibacteraeota bacterium]